MTLYIVYMYVLDIFLSLFPVSSNEYFHTYSYQYAYTGKYKYFVNFCANTIYQYNSVMLRI